MYIHVILEVSLIVENGVNSTLSSSYLRRYSQDGNGYMLIVCTGIDVIWTTVHFHSATMEVVLMCKEPFDKFL